MSRQEHSGLSAGWSVGVNKFCEETQGKNAGLEDCCVQAGGKSVVVGKNDGHTKISSCERRKRTGPGEVWWKERRKKTSCAGVPVWPWRTAGIVVVRK